MKILNSVTILGRKFRVRNNLSEDQMKGLLGDGTCPLGAMNFSLMLIAIREHKNKSEQAVTFFHECLHAMQYITGLSQITNTDVAEIWCESGANAMLDVFKQMK